VVFGGVTIAETTNALRILETSHPPVYYLPLDDVRDAHLVASAGLSTFCEWKGVASYLDVVAGRHTAARAAWTYRAPSAAYQALADHVAFYAEPMEACYVDDQRVRAQLGQFYGGWITDDIVGPFKGPPATRGW